MNLLSRFLAVPTPRRMIKVAGVASVSMAAGVLAYFLWFDGVLATVRSLGTMSVMADRLAARGQLRDAENLLRAALAIEEEHRFKVPFGIEARFGDDLRRDFVAVLRKEGRTREAAAVAAQSVQP